MDASAYAALQNAFVRMVVPLRREFGVALDVQRMRHDIEYAQAAVTLAKRSSQPSLAGCAQLVDQHVEVNGPAIASLSQRRNLGGALLKSLSL